MFNFICKSFPYMRNSIRALPTQRLQHSFQLNHLLSSSQSSEALKNLVSDNAKDHSFTVNYFISKCGFAPEKAISASKYVNFNDPDKPDSVIAFLKNQGFSETQVLKLIKKCPAVVLCDPEKTLLPKIDFFMSQGVSEVDMPVMLSGVPDIFQRSLDRVIIPCFVCLKKLLGSTEETILPIIRCPRLFIYFQNHVIPNVEILREAGVPEARIKKCLIHSPRALIRHPDKFKVVEEVKKMGFDPRKSTFLVATIVMGELSGPAWKKKMETYKKWGCSEDEVLAAFVMYPWCMSVSEDKIDGIMGFFKNEMGWDPSILIQAPNILSLSLNRRIIPRCSVYRVLLSKGFVKKHISLYALLRLSEDKFRKRCIEFNEKEAPELLKLYQEKMELSR